MKRVTKKLKKQVIQYKIRTSLPWARQACLRIFKQQTFAEKESNLTFQHNKVGFGAFDAKTLSKIAKKIINDIRLSQREEMQIQQKMPKYWAQLINLSDQVTLEKHCERFQQ